MKEKPPHSPRVSPPDTSKGHADERPSLDKPVDALSRSKNARDSLTESGVWPDPSKSLAEAVDEALSKIGQISRRLDELCEQAVTQNQLEALTERLQHLEYLVELATAWLPYESDSETDESRKPWGETPPDEGPQPAPPPDEIAPTGKEHSGIASAEAQVQQPLTAGDSRDSLDGEVPPSGLPQGVEAKPLAVPAGISDDLTPASTISQTSSEQTGDHPDLPVPR